LIGTFVNTAAVVVGGLIGLMLHKTLHPKYKSIYFQAIGLFTMAIGITMFVTMQHILIVVASLAIGSLLGAWIDLEKYANTFSDFMKRKLNIGNERFTEGLTTAFLLFCVGAMTIVGAVDEGVGRSSEVLLTKSLMDGFSSILLASALGVGVVFSAIPLFIFQASITLLAQSASTFFTPDIINGIRAVGGVLLVGLGLNILDIKKINVLNMLPALFVIVLLLWASNHFF